MPLDEQQKKHLLYGAGAVASIIGLVYVFGRNKTSAMPSYPAAQRPTTGAGSANESAQIAAATQLTLAQNAKDIAMAQIAASTQNARTMAEAQTSAARSASQGAAARAAMAPGGAATQGVKGLFDLLKELFAGGSGTGNDSISGADQAQLDFYKQYLDAPLYGNNLGDSIGPSGGFLDPNSPSNASWYVEPQTYEDYYQGSTGSGDSSWFGSSPSDPNSWATFEGFGSAAGDTSWATFEGFSGSSGDTSWATFEGLGGGE